jgi:hypothetical protein
VELAPRGPGKLPETGKRAAGDRQPQQPRQGPDHRKQPLDLSAGRSAEAVGRATTAAVVKALVWVVAAATGTTMVFTNLGF